MDGLKSAGSEYCGIICIDKPQGFTSFDVIAKLRGILKIKRLGHAGTLDPMATGVLPVFVGKATKACDILPDHDKTYEAGFKLGETTDTQDITGTVTNKVESFNVSADDINNALEKFRGNIMQIPPMYSAVSVGGKRLYDLARKGIEVEREARPITVYNLELLNYDEKSACGVMSISCSKGTYIRTLINDIGDALSCGGIMTTLIRTSACGFELESCTTLDELQSVNTEKKFLDRFIYPIENVFMSCPEIRISGAQERMYRNGVKLDSERVKIPEKAERYRVYGSNEFIGTAYIDYEKNELRAEKNFLA